jgi:hypothetical protein
MSVGGEIPSKKTLKKVQKKACQPFETEINGRARRQTGWNSCSKKL